MLKRDRLLGPIVGTAVVLGGTLYMFVLLAGAVVGAAARSVLGSKDT